MSFQNSQPKLPFWGYTNEIRHTQVLLLCKKKTPTSKIVDVACGLHLLFYQHLKYNIADDILYFSEKINGFIMTHQAVAARGHLFPAQRGAQPRSSIGFPLQPRSRRPPMTGTPIKILTGSWRSWVFPWVYQMPPMTNHINSNFGFRFMCFFFILGSRGYDRYFGLRHLQLETIPTKLSQSRVHNNAIIKTCQLVCDSGNPI